jgi:uncharacterized Zn-binding protein involved in type VI secretion
MANVIRLNDPTSHGGKVESVAATHFTVGGIAVACLGDKCTCPVPARLSKAISTTPSTAFRSPTKATRRAVAQR